MRTVPFLRVLCLLAAISLYRAALAAEPGFEPLFDGRTLSGWSVKDPSGPGYVVRDGMIVCPKDGGGFLISDKDYSDFVLLFDVSFDKAGNNGVALRSARTGHPSFDAGMEVQILDDDDPAYGNIQPGQHSGSIYLVAPARRRAMKPAGQWNAYEITARGRRITIRINGKTVVDANLNDVRDPAILAAHPGILRDSGAVGFLGHGPSEVRFRNIRICDLSTPERDNTPPPGFAALFNGVDLGGWKGLVENPPARAAVSAGDLAAREIAATVEALRHWRVVDGVITYDGKNDSLCTARDYGDFELLVDWKISEGGDSGIYLRGSPQVQIWDHPDGSGGLYNNLKNPSKPTARADNPPGQWNRFRILMVGEKVTVFLNGALVVHDVTMENYWERGRPIYPSGQIELQHHGSDLWFKNIYIRELPRA